MKKIILCLTALLLLAMSCKKENKERLGCKESYQNQDWAYENFKTNYSIQFPSNYEGGMTGFEGNLFYKKRTDDNLTFTHEFCGIFYCPDFGDTLAFPFPNTIITKDKENNDITLDLKKEFCKNGNLIGILYHNSAISATGKLYMKQGNKYLAGLTIYFINTEYQEVENIIRTIKEN